MTTSRRHSNSRRDSRRKSRKLTVIALVTCPNCGVKTLPHRVCGACGHYKGKLVVAQKVKGEKTAK